MPSCPECKSETNGRRFCVQCGKPQLRFEDINPDGADRVLLQYTSAPACLLSYATLSTGLRLSISSISFSVDISVKLKSIDVSSGFCHNAFQSAQWKAVTSIECRQSSLQRLINRFAGFPMVADAVEVTSSWLSTTARRHAPCSCGSLTKQIVVNVRDPRRLLKQIRRAWRRFAPSAAAL